MEERTTDLQVDERVNVCVYVDDRILKIITVQPVESVELWL